jgi:hypothetical protein
MYGKRVRPQSLIACFTNSSVVQDLHVGRGKSVIGYKSLAYNGNLNILSSLGKLSSSASPINEVQVMLLHVQPADSAKRLIKNGFDRTGMKAYKD